MQNKRIRLLLIEDDRVDQMAFERHIKQENIAYDYTIAGSVAECREILKSAYFDVIIADYMLGDGVSFELFDMFKDAPVIVTTGSGNEKIAVEAMNLGASDYLIKDPDGSYLKTLPTTVDLVLKRHNNEKELQHYHEHLESMVEERTAELYQSLSQEKNLTRIIEKSLNEIFLFDADSYKFVFVNEGALASIGYSRAELLEMTPLDIKPEIDAPIFEKIVAPLHLGKQEKVVFETVHRRKDGSTYPVEVHLQKAEYSSRPVFVAVILDITERNKMEQRYLELVEGTTDLITQVDGEGKLLYVNHMSKEIFGSDPQQLIGQDAFQFVHPDDRERTVAWFNNCLNKKALKASIENRQINQQTGAVHDMLWSSNFHYDEQGRPLSVNGIGRDITDTKESVKDRVRLATAIEQATETVVITDVQGSIQYINPAFETLTGYSREEALGQNPRILQSGKHDQLFYKKMWTTLLQGEVWKGHLTNKKKDGSLFEEEVTISPVKNSKGRIINFVAVKRDVTKEVALEQQLLHAIKMEAIGTLASGIAHDFNNILAAIMGYGEIIKHEVPAESRVARDIAEVLAAAQRAEDLVQQVLTFSRKTDQKKQPLRPHLIIKEALKMLQASFPSTILIEKDIDPDCGLIMADPTNIHQVIVNLCTNSLHAMADQKGTLSVSLQRCELSAAEMIGEPTLPAGPYVVLTVTDTGCGMDKATMELIFDPFYTTREVGKGTGLGLAVIHGIVQDGKGFIRVKSTLGKGSSFSVYLPLFQKKTSIAGDPDQDSTPLGGSEHILVVDDEPLIVRATQRQLENLGYLVTGTTKSRDALEIIRTSPNEIDLLITDQTMPGLTGAALAQAAMEIKPDLPVIICTGHSELVSKRKAMKSGIKKYIIKPLAGDKLFRAVRSVLNGK